MANRIAMQWSVEEVVISGIVTDYHLSPSNTTNVLKRLKRAIYSNRKSNSEQSYVEYVSNQQ
jgi:hypothetical protein